MIFLSSAQIFAAENILLHSEDVRVSRDIDEKTGSVKGYHLFIRKKTGIESVLLTETTKDPNGKEDSYAFRALEFNEINGNEKRMLNGKFLDSPGARYSLIDSTAEADSVFGEAFHIYIPNEIAFGYAWTRNGSVKIGRGTFINIRSFQKKYADYNGDFADNPFMFDFEKSVESDEVSVPSLLRDDYNPVAADSFKRIAESGEGDFTVSDGPDSLVDDLMNSIEKINSRGNVDIVFVLDATGSMKDDVEKLRADWIPRLESAMKKFKDFRVALLLYRDYEDLYNTKGLPVKKYEFTGDLKVFRKCLFNFGIKGDEGGDVPEAVYEGLYAALDFYDWRDDAERKVILVGDAEPHPEPRGTGKYTKALVEETARKKNIKIDTIIVPDNKEDRGR